ncbi:MAG: hypothetical protein KF861_17660, partial [Planctomycetaceae bacterium]|nr:hypothetical protein [Planctomycetaceae bacterium]
PNRTDAAEPSFDVLAAAPVRRVDPLSDPAAGPQAPLPAASFNVFARPPAPLAALQFDVFDCRQTHRTSCHCRETGECHCGERCPCVEEEEPITDYVEIHTRDGCGPCERFRAGPLVALKKWNWRIGPHGHVRIIKHAADWHEPVPQFRFHRAGKEFARRTGYLTEWQIAQEFEGSR